MPVQRQNQRHQVQEISARIVLLSLVIFGCFGNRADAWQSPYPPYGNSFPSPPRPSYQAQPRAMTPPLLPPTTHYPPAMNAARQPYRPPPINWEPVPFISPSAYPNTPQQPPSLPPIPFHNTRPNYGGSQPSLGYPTPMPSAPAMYPPSLPPGSTLRPPPTAPPFGYSMPVQRPQMQPVPSPMPAHVPNAQFSNISGPTTPIASPRFETQQRQLQTPRSSNGPQFPRTVDGYDPLFDNVSRSTQVWPTQGQPTTTGPDAMLLPPYSSGQPFVHQVQTGPSEVPSTGPSFDSGSGGPAFDTGPGQPTFGPPQDMTNFAAASSPPVGRRRPPRISPGGYIDSPVPRDTFGFRFDFGSQIDVPDRAEMFYGKCGCFRIVGDDPTATGPPRIESGIKYQDLAARFESTLHEDFSYFAEFPLRFLNPESNANTIGFADMNAGFKAVLASSPDRNEYFTFQLRTYFPTGDASRGLGTSNVSLEPAFLYQKQLNERVSIQAELRDWIALDGTDFAGNVIRYGLGVGIDLKEDCNSSLQAVFEGVGWTVLEGKEFRGNSTATGGEFRDSAGITIVNLKAGLRWQFERQCNWLRDSLYIGYGRAVTHEMWYGNLLRVDYQIEF